MKHVPIRPAREDIGEQVFSRRWKELMETNPAGLYSTKPIYYVLRGYPYVVNQRAASVLASMVCWLGTNVGKGFLLLAEDFRDNTTCRFDCYLAAWGVRNARKVGMNSCARQLEFITRTQDDMDKGVFTDVSIRDLEAIDQLCIWLGGAEGQEFLKGCEEEIERRKDLETIAFHSEAGRQNSPHARKLVDKFAIKD
jgi:hypothetical protein